MVLYKTGVDQWKFQKAKSILYSEFCLLKINTLTKLSAISINSVFHLYVTY